MAVTGTGGGRIGTNFVPSRARPSLILYSISMHAHPAFVQIPPRGRLILEAREIGFTFGSDLFFLDEQAHASKEGIASSIGNQSIRFHIDIEGNLDVLLDSTRNLDSRHTFQREESKV